MASVKDEIGKIGRVVKCQGVNGLNGYVSVPIVKRIARVKAPVEAVRLRTITPVTTAHR
jgi:hypothetical protein